jgi:transketolase
MIRNTVFTDAREYKATRDGFGEALLELGKTNEKVVALSADLMESTKVQAFAKAYPKRFFEMGVAEQAMSGVASGVASMGYIPFMTSYAMFSPGRNWEQIRTTICYNNVPVKIIGAHAGVSVGPDGATHQALEDVAIMQALPNMQVIVPCDAIESYKATLALPEIHSPVYLRLTREKTPLLLSDSYEYEHGKAYIVYVPKKDHVFKVGIIGCGPILYEACLAAKALEEEGIGVTVANMPTVKPLDTAFLLRFAREMKKLVTVEEHQITGGLGSVVATFLSAHAPTPVGFIGVNDQFGQSGTPEELYEHYGLTSVHIAAKVKEMLGK